MKPTDFDEMNGSLLGGPGERYATELDVADLSVFRGGGEIISCWQPSWRDRLRLLFGGRIWLRVLAPSTHAPVAVDTEYPFERAAKGVTRDG